MKVILKIQIFLFKELEKQNEQLKINIKIN